MAYLKAKYIGLNSVSNAKLSQIANKRLKGRLSPGTGNVEDISLSEILLKLSHYYLVIQNDFEQGAAHPWGGGNYGSGSGTMQVVPADTSACGVIACTTGTTSWGYSGIRYSSGVSSIFATQVGELISVTKVSLPVLSTDLQRFTLRIGFGDSFTDYEHWDSCGYFEYSGNVNAGQWVIATANNATRTKTNTTVPAVTGSWIYLKTITNAAGTQTDFYINNVPVGSISTNIPTTQARAFDYVCLIIKTVGSTSRTLLVDRCFMAKERNDVDYY